MISLRSPRFRIGSVLLEDPTMSTLVKESLDKGYKSVLLLVEYTSHIGIRHPYID